MDGRSLVAYGLEGEQLDDLPLIPDFLVIRQRDRFWRLDQTGEADVGFGWYQRMVQDELVRVFGTEVPWEPGSWVIVEEAGPVLFPKEEEPKKRALRARELVSQATSMKGDPEKALSMLRAAGGLVRIPVERLVSRLESARESPSESLVDILRRTR